MPAWAGIDEVAGVATGADDTVVAVVGADGAGTAFPEDPDAEPEAAEVLGPPSPPPPPDPPTLPLPLPPLLLPTRRR